MKQVRGDIVVSDAQTFNRHEQIPFQVTGEIRLDLKREEIDGIRYYKERVLGLVEVPYRVYSQSP